MRVDKAAYVRYAEGKAKKSPLLLDCVKAFVIGGAICTLAQGLTELYGFLGASLEDAKTFTTVSLIVLTALATGFGFFDRIAKHAGAGTLVPITGFANSVVSPAIDNKAEGLVLGVGAKIFIVAGPVILYGTLASVIYGVVYYFMSLG